MGYLDLGKNNFCVKRSKLCPINFNITFNFGNDGKFSKTSYNRGDTHNYTLNRLYASEIEESTIFDINKFYISNDDKSKQHKYEEEKFYPLAKLLDYKNLYKNEFYIEIL